MDGRRIPADHLWLVLAGEHGGHEDRYGSGYRATDGRESVIVTRAERKSQQAVTCESGLTADDWLAKDGQ